MTLQFFSRQVNERKARVLVLLLLIVTFSLLIGFFGLAIYSQFSRTSDRTQVYSPEKCEDRNKEDKKIDCLPILVVFSSGQEKQPKALWAYKNGQTTQLLMLSGVESVGKYQLDKSGKNLYFIKNEEINNSVIGIELHKFYVDTNLDSVIVQKIQLEEQPWKYSLSDFELSHDGQKIAFVRDGIWILDLNTGKTGKIVESKYYDEKTTAGHTYSQVKWSPSDKFLYGHWYQYEGDGDDLINISTKEVTLLGSGLLEPRLAFAEFITDTRGIFISNVPSAKTLPGDKLVEKEFFDLGTDITLEAAQAGDFFYPKYLASQDRIYYINQRVVKETADGVVSTTQVAYFDRQTGKTVELTSDFFKDVNAKNLTISADGSYALFDVNGDIWAVSTNGQGMGILIENASRPVVP